MNIFGFQPDQILARIRAGAKPAQPLTRNQSMARGAYAFCIVSLLGFAPWAVGGRWLAAQVGELGMHSLCALAFMGSAGLALRNLIIGPVPLARFYALFSSAFFLYALAWCVAWFTLARPLGMRPAGLVGSLLGTSAMGLILANAFGAQKRRWPIIGTLFLAHTIGYFAGDLLYAWSHTNMANSLLVPLMGKTGISIFGKSLWGLAYGLGLGAGLGGAFYSCQEEVRERLSNSGAASPAS